MGLEVFDSIFTGRSLDDFEIVERFEPDQFPMVEDGEFAAGHRKISELLSSLPDMRGNAHSLVEEGVVSEVIHSEKDQRSIYLLCLIERCLWYENGHSGLDYTNHYNLHYFFGYGAINKLIARMLAQGIDNEKVLLSLARFLAAHRGCYYWTDTLSLFIDACRQWRPSLEPGSPLHESNLIVRAHLTDGDGYGHEESLVEKIDDWLGAGIWQTLATGEHWSDLAIERIEAMPEASRDAWLALLEHCGKAKSAKPNNRWSKLAPELLNKVGKVTFVQELLAWMARFNEGRSHLSVSSVWEATDESQRVHDRNGNVLRGLLWVCATFNDDRLTRMIGQVGMSSYRKARGLGPRATKVGNAAVYTLGQIPGLDAVGQLALLKVKVKTATAQKGIEKALNTAAEREQLPREEIEEMSVPTYGLAEVGKCVQPLGDFTAELVITGTTSTELRWIKPDGKQQKSVPKAVKDNFADELKDLKAAAKDIQKMLPAQRDRVDQLHLQNKTWAYSTWEERYLNHTLVGTLARRLIWVFEQGEGKEKVEAAWLDGQLVDVEGNPVEVDSDAAIVSLWHPIGHDEAQITAWRAFFEEREIKQPFKQAHREVYILTDAERNTNTYSNRYASHIIKQHQYNALCGARGWRNALRLMVDDEVPSTSRMLRAYGLRAEFWVEGVGEDYGTDTNDAGTFLYLSTDQVRFHRLDAAENWGHAFGGGFTTEAAGPGTDNVNEPIPLDQIDPLVLSEVLRDVDLFIGVASVGNDPNWQDGGPEGRYQDYWQSYSFGDLGATAQTRKEILERLVPRLKIAERCAFDEKFLIVRGDIRTYKIHLGSSNILMEPNDQYLCIVSGRGDTKAGDKVFLPFEGDQRLAVILSKAMMLAEDTKIKDQTILSQIKR